MSFQQWRQFNFFDKNPVSDPDDPSRPPPIFQRTDITASTSGRGQIILGDAQGYVHIVDKQFQFKSFQAYGVSGSTGRISHLKQIKQRNVLLTIGEDDPINSTPTLKLWDLDVASPALLKTLAITPSPNSRPHPVSAFAILENLTQLAIGLANGVVILIRGNLAQDRTTKQRIIHESDEPITALGFRESSKNVFLFVVTINSVITYNTNAPPAKSTPSTLDDQGSALGCAIMSESTGEMVIGRDEAIYFYETNARGQCFAYDTPKSSLAYFKTNYLIILSPPTPISHSRRPSSYGGSGPITGSNLSSSIASPDLSHFTIFDTTHKFIAYLGSFPTGVRFVICEWGSIFVVSLDGKLFRLEEKDMPTKLDILFKKNMYLLAINLAHSSKYDDASVAEIFRRYGDFLYNKTDYDGAMAQYLHTIGKLEPSYVIRKFLDAQRIYNLTSYLQELHSHGLANSDHTTLLLNCYTKLKDVERLDLFIKTDKELMFDPETAIKVCRQAGYFAHAVYLAEKFQDHDGYLDIIIEDIKDYQKALSYLRTLKPLDVGKNLQKYGKILLTYLPDQTTILLIDLCSGALVSGAAIKPVNSPDPQLIQNFNALPLGSPSSNTGSPAPSYFGHLERRVSVSARFQIPSPREYMSLFIDHPDHLVVFLESVCEKRWGPNEHVPASYSRPGSPDAPSRTSIGADSTVSQTLNDTEEEMKPDLKERAAIWNTLLELYLMDEKPAIHNETSNPPSAISPINSISSLTVDRDKKKKLRERKEKAIKLLKDQTVPYDMNQALVLCHLKDFREGIVYLYERMGMFGDVLKYWMEKGETAKVIESLRKYGPQDSALYPQTLTYFSSTQEILSQSTSELLSVLNLIDSQNMLPPLQVIDALSKSSVATVGLLKGYMGRKIESTHREIEEDKALIEAYQTETEKKKKEVEDLKTSARIFQVTRCSECRRPLDLPSVHFLCRHSFHLRCLPETSRECPKCVEQNHVITEVRHEQEQNAGSHDLFFTQLKKADDGFEVVGDYFSKNTMAFAKFVD